jgi:hypothetical protein
VDHVYQHAASIQDSVSTTFETDNIAPAVESGTGAVYHDSTEHFTVGVDF